MSAVAAVARERSGEIGTVYLLCWDYIDPRTAQPRPLHYYGWAKKGDGRERIRQHMRGVSHAKLPTAMHARGLAAHVGRIWSNATRADERALKRGGNATRRCLRCRRARAGARVGETLGELLARSVERAAGALKARRRT